MLDHAEGAFWPWPVLGEQPVSGPPDHDAQGEPDDYRVVELTRHRDEIRDQVNRHRQVGRHAEQQHPVPAWQAWITCESGKEEYAIWNEPGEGRRILAPARDPKSHDDAAVDHDDDQRCPNEPTPRHGSPKRREAHRLGVPATRRPERPGRVLGSFTPDDNRPMERSVGRLIFYPIAIGLFLLVDTALRATGH